eukprot:11203954-Lingulodinium_polyedra.AAC.1
MRAGSRRLLMLGSAVMAPPGHGAAARRLTAASCSRAWPAISRPTCGARQRCAAMAAASMGGRRPDAAQGAPLHAGPEGPPAA